MDREFRHIVRVLDIDLEGTKGVAYALTSIKGISLRFAYAILKTVGINPEERLGFLSESDVEKIETIARNPKKYGLPDWLLNRRKDLEEGEDFHLIGSDLDLKIKADIERMKRIRSWGGYRHTYGLTVRGQKTRTTGRMGKSVGVRKRGVISRG